MVSESIWYGSSSLVQQKFDRVYWTFVKLNLGSTHGAPFEVAKVKLIQLGLGHEKYSVWTRPKTPFLSSGERKGNKLIHYVSYSFMKACLK